MERLPRREPLRMLLDSNESMLANDPGDFDRRRLSRSELALSSLSSVPISLVLLKLREFLDLPKLSRRALLGTRKEPRPVSLRRRLSPAMSTDKAPMDLFIIVASLLTVRLFTLLSGLGLDEDLRSRRGGDPISVDFRRRGFDDDPRRACDELLARERDLLRSRSERVELLRRLGEVWREESFFPFLLVAWLPEA